MNKYRHTFNLLDGTEIVTESESRELCHITIGSETAFYVETEYALYTMPFFNVSYIETEEIDGEAEELCEE